MSVYIPGMQIPTAPVLFCLHPDGKVFADLEGDWREYKAVPVPPHGRLIDADALKKKRHWTDDFYETEYVEVEDIDAAPTIIPAEEG